MKKKFFIGISVVVGLSIFVYLGLPAFAQTRLASLIPGTPLEATAAWEIITNSGLPKEELLDGETNSLTRCRDAVNAYRYAHSMLNRDGWYRGISEDHIPLLEALVLAMESEGYMSVEPIWEARKTEILADFWYDSDTQNAKGLGFVSLDDYYSTVAELSKLDIGSVLEAESLRSDFEAKWK